MKHRLIKNKNISKAYGFLPEFLFGRNFLSLSVTVDSTKIGSGHSSFSLGTLEIRSFQPDAI